MYFCLNCLSKKEEKLFSAINSILERETDLPFEVWFPKKEIIEKKGKIKVLVKKPLFPGYIFIFWGGEDDSFFPFRSILSLPYVFKFLHYGNNLRALSGRDLDYALWIHTNKGLIKQSAVSCKEGEKLKVISGPLVGFEGQISKVDKHHKKVWINFELGGQISSVSFSVDFLEPGNVKKILD